MKIYFTNAGIHKYSIKKVLETALATLGQPSDALEMSLSVVSEQEIQLLNSQFRNVDAVTDVLSFPTANLNKQVVSQGSFDCDNVNPTTGRLNLGDVVICLARAKEQAVDFGHGLKREMCFLSLHGLLHLLGYDHLQSADEQEMTDIQKQILNRAGVHR